jgi:hypothetical protein
MCLNQASLHNSQTTSCYTHVWFPLGIHPFKTSMNLSELNCGYTTKECQLRWAMESDSVEEVDEKI